MSNYGEFATIAGRSWDIAVVWSEVVFSPQVVAKIDDAPKVQQVVALNPGRRLDPHPSPNPLPSPRIGRRKGAFARAQEGIGGGTTILQQAVAKIAAAPKVQQAVALFPLELIQSRHWGPLRWHARPGFSTQGDSSEVPAGLRTEARA